MYLYVNTKLFFFIGIKKMNRQLLSESNYLYVFKYLKDSILGAFYNS